MDGPEASTVAGSHIGVESLNGVSPGQLTVLLVHVVSAGARVVADPDTEVLDLQGVLLGDLRVPFVSHDRPEIQPSLSPKCPTYLVAGNDLTSGLLDLLQAAQEVPVPGLGHNLVGGEDPHAVQGGSRVGLRGQVAPDDLVFVKTT